MDMMKGLPPETAAGQGWAEKLAGLTRNDLEVMKQICAEARADRFWRGMEYLSQVTGVRRASVADAIGRLQIAGLLKFHRDAKRLRYVEVIPLNIRIICATTRPPVRRTRVTMKVHNINAHKPVCVSHETNTETKGPRA